MKYIFSCFSFLDAKFPFLSGAALSIYSFVMLFINKNPLNWFFILFASLTIIEWVVNSKYNESNKNIHLINGNYYKNVITSKKSNFLEKDKYFWKRIFNKLTKLIFQIIIITFSIIYFKSNGKIFIIAIASINLTLDLIGIILSSLEIRAYYINPIIWIEYKKQAYSRMAKVANDKVQIWEEINKKQAIKDAETLEKADKILKEYQNKKTK